MSSKTNLSILTLNVRGLRSTTKRTTVFQWLLAQNFEIILLQETYFTKFNKYKIMKQWNGKSIHGHSNSLFSKGVSILFKPGLDVKVENEHLWDFMFESLKLFNFGPMFCQWIKTMYTNPVFCLKNMGIYRSGLPWRGV